MMIPRGEKKSEKTMGGTVPGIRGVYIGIDIEVIITLSCVPKIASDLIIECVSLALSLSFYVFRSK